MRIGLIGIAGNKHVQTFGHAAKRFIFSPVRIKGSKRCKIGDGNSAGIGGEEIFRQYSQFDRRAAILGDEDTGRPDLAFKLSNMRHDLRTRGRGIGATLHRPCGQLHGNSGVSHSAGPFWERGKAAKQLINQVRLDS